MPTYSNDIYGMLLKIADGTGSPDTYSHDEYGQIRRIADTIGASGAYSGDKYSQLKRIADAVGAAGTYTSDIYGQILRIADAGPSGAYTNDIYGQLSRIAANGIGATIQISSATVADTASIGAVVGALSVVGGTGSYTFTFATGGNPGSLFSISGSNLQVAAALTAGSYAITVHAVGTGNPPDRAFLITVTHAGVVALAMDMSDFRNTYILGL
jgi:hypothetical protein